MTINTYTFGNTPEMAFSDGEVLAGFEPALNWPSWDRARALVTAYCESVGWDADPDDEFYGLSEEEGFLEHADGRLALVGLTVEGHEFMVEGGARG